MTTKHLSICDRAIHLLNIWATAPHKILGNCINIPSCHSHVAFLRSQMWHVCLDRPVQQLTWKTKFVTCASQESSPQIRKSSSQEVCQAWNQSPKASLQGGDLHPLSGSLRKLLGYWECHPSTTLEPRFGLVTTPQTLSQQNLLSFQLA